MGYCLIWGVLGDIDVKVLLATLASAGIFAFGSIGAAAAADLITSPPAAVPEANAFDWTGLYVGANAGYVWSSSNTSFTNDTQIVGPGVVINTIPIDANPQGFVGGVQLGYNQQMGNFVLGVEGALDYADITTTFPDPLIGRLGGGAGAPVAGDTVTSRSDYTGTVLLRAGLALDHFMPYVAGGLAVAHVTTTATAGGADDSGLATGWALGAGINLALDDNWSTSLQYLHTDLSGPTMNASKFYATNSHPTSESVTAGVNYKF